MEIHQAGLSCSTTCRVALLRSPAHIERLEGGVLADLQLALAYEFQRGGKGAGDCRDALFRRCQITQQVMLQHRPAADVANHARQQFAGIGQGPDSAARDRDLGHGLALTERRIGGQEIVKACLVRGFLPVRNMLRRAAGKDITAETVAVDKPACSLAHGFEAFQAEGKRCGHLLAGGTVVLDLLRDQQAGLEIGEPCRHHEIIGGKLDADAAGGFDELQILLGKRQHRNARKIDLLVAGEVEEEIERAFEAGDVDHQRRLMARAVGTIVLPKLVHRRCRRLGPLCAFDRVHLCLSSIA